MNTTLQVWLAMTRRVSLLMVVSAGCGAASEGLGPHAGGTIQAGGTSLDLLSRKQFLLAVVESVEQTLQTVVMGSTPGERSVVLSALGLDGSALSLHAAMPCPSTPITYAVTCLSDFDTDSLGPELDGCFQDGCYDMARWFVDTYIVKRPKRSSGDRELIQYSAAEPRPAQIVYNPSPATHWEFEFVNGAVNASAVLMESLAADLAEGGHIDLAYMGHVRGSLRPGSSFEYSMELDFPALVQEGPIAVSMENGSDRERLGEVTLGTAVIGRLNDAGIVWQTEPSH